MTSKEIAWRLDWNLLRTFIVIVQEKSITAAAGRLGLKQPTVSNALKRLERAVGTRLIDRGPRSFEVTAAGQALYRESRGIFGSVNRLGSALEEAEGEVLGTVELAVATHVTSPLLNDSLSRFNELYPAACMSITVDSSREVIDSVLQKRAALGICLVDEQLPELCYTRLYTGHFGFFCGPRHRLFGKTGLSLDDLAGERSVSFSADRVNDMLRAVAVMRAEAQLDPNLTGVSSSLEEIKRMVVAGLGIGALPIHVVERDVQNGLLFRLPPYDDLPAVDIWVVRHPGATLNRAEQEFIRLLDERIESTPWDERVYR
ncbi:MAG: LysR family transcriptional regulator [Xanthomonadales bacterium]|nr:LysR family transcriptional regulator [Xanthomonadales bacterium]